MRTDTWAAILAKYRQFRSFWAEPVPTGDVDVMLQGLSIQNTDDYREFVARFGGGYVGTYPIYGLRLAESMGSIGGAKTATELTAVFVKKSWPHAKDWLIFSVDQSGSPIGFAHDGSVWISDWGSKSASKLGDDFEHFIRKWGLRVEPM